MFNNTKEAAIEDIKKEIDTCSTLANKAGKKLREEFDLAEGEVTRTTAALMKQIRSKPIQSGLIATAAGFVLGALWRR